MQQVINMKSFTIIIILFSLARISFAQKSVLSGVYVKGIKDIMLNVLLQGTLLDAATQKPIDKCSISIFGSDGSTDALTTDSSGHYECFLRAYSYKLWFEKAYYLKGMSMIEFKHVPDTVKLTTFMRPTEHVSKGTILVDTVIKDRETAINVAEAILFKIYGKENIIRQRPYEVSMIGDNWFLNGTLPEGYLGGTFSIELNATNGQVMMLMHGQ